MKLPRDRMTYAEVAATDPVVLAKYFEFTDLKPGDFFFIKGKADKEFVVEAESFDYEQSKHYFEYGGGQRVAIDECWPVYNATAMIDQLAYYGTFELRSFKTSWLAILGNEIVEESREEEDLIAFLWRIMYRAAIELEY